MTLLYITIVFIFLFMLIEVLSIVMKITGLDLDKARFQIISIITHTGFTTRESELIAQHPVRRKIASFLMVLSYVAQATLISIIFSLIKHPRGFIYFIIILVIIGLLLMLLKKNKIVLSKFDALLEKYISKQLKVGYKNKTVNEVLKLNNEFGVAEIILEEYSPLCNAALKETQLKERYIQILNIDRGSHILHFPNANTLLQAGDRIVVYGKIESIKDLILEQRKQNNI